MTEIFYRDNMTNPTERARGLFHESVNRPDREKSELDIAAESRDLFDTFIRLLKDPFGKDQT